MLNGATTRKTWRAWLLLAVACWACVVPAWAFAPGVSVREAKTRVGFFCANYGEARPAQPVQVAETHREKCAARYDSASGPTVGLYYNRARYLNPDSGRFWSMDNFGGRRSAPSSLHKYSYGDSNPVSLVDPTGMYSILELSISRFADQTIRLTGYAAANATVTAGRTLIYGIIIMYAGATLAAQNDVLGETSGRKRELLEKAMQGADDHPLAVALRMREQDCKQFVCSASRYKSVAAIDSVAQGMGKPSRVNVGPRDTPVWKEFTALNRRLAMKASGLPPVPDQDRHEYPYAVMLQGGSEAHVDYADPGENRSHGSDIKLFLDAHNLRLGHCVDVIVIP